jgi:hypothetical protein
MVLPKDWIYTYTIKLHQRSLYHLQLQLPLVVPWSITTNTTTVLDNCGNVISPSAPVITNTNACGGTTILYYTYTNCDGTSQELVLTLTRFQVDFSPSPRRGGSRVACITDAVMPTPPVVADNCGNSIILPRCSW